MNKQNYIITGGGGSGKTTLINALDASGFQTMPEVSRQIIMEQQQCGGNKFPWSDLLGFGELCMQQMEKQLDKQSADVCFFDRGILDIIAYFELHSLKSTNRFLNRIREYSTTVFICPPWDEIFINDAQRPESFDYATSIYHELKNTYNNLGFKLIDVPRCQVEDRIEFILCNVGIDVNTV